MTPYCCGKTRGSVWRAGSCTRKAQPGSKFCFQHDPANIDKKHTERKARWEEEERVREIARQRAARIFAFNQATRGVLQQIADGHNNPRALARKTLRILEE